MATISVGQRVVERDGRDPIRADVRAVSKNGKRIRVQFWGRGLREGKLTTMWTDASGWQPATPPGPVTSERENEGAP